MSARTGPSLVIATLLLTGHPPTPEEIDQIVDTVLPARTNRQK